MKFAKGMNFELFLLEGDFILLFFQPLESNVIIYISSVDKILLDSISFFILLLLINNLFRFHVVDRSFVFIQCTRKFFHFAGINPTKPFSKIRQPILLFIFFADHKTVQLSKRCIKTFHSSNRNYFLLYNREFETVKIVIFSR